MMGKGRPRAAGPFDTHEELREAIKTRVQKGYYVNQMAKVFGLNWRTVKKIVRELDA